jgi:hypothetical protein
MTSRFITRANREGIPLNRQTSTAGSAKLIFAGAALIVLLIAGTIAGRNHSVPSPTTTAQAYAPNSLLYPTATQPNALDGVKHPSANSPRSVNPQRRIASPSHRADLQMPSITPSSLPLIGRTLPDTNAFSAVPAIAQAKSFNSSSKFPRFRLSVPREIAGQESDLLTACVCGPLAPVNTRAYFEMASSAEFFRSDVDAYRTTLKPEFKPDPATLQLIENVRQ